jgi:CTP synthase
MTRYVFITGGVVSSLGKGIAAAALGALLQARGYKVRLRKLDPYLNVDPGTMSPYQHGEVFVTDDGAETDLDLGHYERFTGVSATKNDSITTGKIYQNVISRERQGGYLGGTVQVIPHITDEIKTFIRSSAGDADFVICEIGGTVGDIEGLPFLEAIRQLGNEMTPRQTMYVHATLMPYIPSAGELKTKPTQHSVKELLSVGIQPDLLLCRAEHEIPAEQRRKLALFCNVRPERVVAAYDVKTIYGVPEAYHAEGFDGQVLAHFGMKAKAPDMKRWHAIVQRVVQPKYKTRIAIVGKYTSLLDSYKSLIEALTHGGIANNARVELDWIDAEEISPRALTARLAKVDGILVPGGFGVRGTAGKIAAIKYAREKKIPYFGICFGMQMAVLEAAQNLLGLKDASSTEFGPCKNPVVCLMTEWEQGGVKQRRTTKSDLGGTMRLGAYPCKLKPNSKVRKIYGQANISERHRHRYEVNISYRKQLEKIGVVFCGLSPDGELPEMIERKDHPWFVGVQFHPELKSRPFDPHPLFVGFVGAALKKKIR